MSEDNIVVEVKNLKKSFNGFTAVKNVNLIVFKGDVYGFLGPNGAGKSTTLRCILSLIKPDSGEIKIFNKKPKENRIDIFSKIGSIVEKPDFYKYLSAKTNLQIFGRMFGANVNSKNIEEKLEFVGLKGREKDLVKGYSHGMKQRLGIALTLLHNPELIILDEPTTGLDPQGIIDIRNLIINLQKDLGKTIILSSHLLSEIELIASRMIIINKGENIVEGNVNELLNNEELVVEFIVKNSNEAIKCLGLHKFNPEYINDNKFQLRISESRIPFVISILTENKFDIYSVNSRKKLEDLFVKLTNEKTNI